MHVRTLLLRPVEHGSVVCLQPQPVPLCLGRPAHIKAEYGKECKTVSLVVLPLNNNVLRFTMQGNTPPSGWPCQFEMTLEAQVSYHQDEKRFNDPNHSFRFRKTISAQLSGPGATSTHTYTHPAASGASYKLAGGRQQKRSGLFCDSHCMKGDELLQENCATQCTYPSLPVCHPLLLEGFVLRERFVSEDVHLLNRPQNDNQSQSMVCDIPQRRAKDGGCPLVE